MRRFQDWLFAYDTPHAMALLRIVLGTLASVSLLMLLPNASVFFSSDGLLPAAQLDQWQFRITVVHLLKGADPATAFAFVGALAAVAITFTVGWQTRIMAVLLAVGLTVLQNRNPLILNSGDGMLRLALIYMAFAPSGLCLSVDRWLIVRHAIRAGRVPPVVPRVSLWPQRIIALQIALLYLAATWHKWYGPSWRDGTAAWYPLQLPEFNRFPLPAFLETLGVAKVMTYGTLGLELLLCTMVFYKPARKWALLSGVLFHALLDYRLNIPLFGPTVVACYIAFYDGSEARDWLVRTRAWWASLKHPLARRQNRDRSLAYARSGKPGDYGGNPLLQSEIEKSQNS
jgi:hypothetical protein